jgi:hypothetical protein
MLLNTTINSLISKPLFLARSCIPSFPLRTTKRPSLLIYLFNPISGLVALALLLLFSFPSLLDIYCGPTPPFPSYTTAFERYTRLISLLTKSSLIISWCSTVDVASIVVNAEFYMSTWGLLSTQMHRQSVVNLKNVRPGRKPGDRVHSEEDH